MSIVKWAVMRSLESIALHFEYNVPVWLICEEVELVYSNIDIKHEGQQWP